MPKNIKKEITKHKDISYTAKDFNSLRSELLVYARQHYGNKIIDFTENSIAGLFLDMAAYVGDNMSFYLDHQFNELNPNTVVESQNIETMVRNAGIKIMGNSPASVTVDFYIEISKTTDSSNC